MKAKLRVGIIFGGPSREREISFAGGRTVFDNLDKRLFEPVPLFMDAKRNLILLDWPFVYKGTIRDFWPPVNHYPSDAGPYQLSEESLGALSQSERKAMASEIGRSVAYDELPSMIDVAFLALHGVGGEDGAIQGMLESLDLPYTGSGIPGSAIGMDKVLQKRLMAAAGFHVPPSISLERSKWESISTSDSTRSAFAKTLFEQAIEELGTPLVIRGANQGSSIGVTILKDPTVEQLAASVDKAFFRQTIDVAAYRKLNTEERRTYIGNVADLRHGIGFPMRVDGIALVQPIELQHLLDQTSKPQLTLVGGHTEVRAVIEGFLDGTEVSTIVLRDEDGGTLPLLPTEIVKGGEVFDYRSKYLPGLSRKKTPADLPIDQIAALRKEAARLFDYFEFDTYARIDGFVSSDGRVSLNDPNTTSGMLPSSFFFHQSAEIGLSPGDFLTYILRTSLRERDRRTVLPNANGAMAKLIDTRLEELQAAGDDRRKVAVLLGGYSSERHISVESGRNVFEKLASSGVYAPTPVFVAGDSDSHRLYALPINLLLKDNADDIRQAIESNDKALHPSTVEARQQASAITERFSSSQAGYEIEELSYDDLSSRFDEVFIGLHGRPGEDGEVQRKLEAVGLPYNGSGFDSSQLTINKFDTLSKLGAAGFIVTKQRLVTTNEWLSDPKGVVKQLGEAMGYPMIVKPVDDGCSSAVQKINTPERLHDFLTLLLNTEPARAMELRKRLGIHPKDEVSQKPVALVEQLIARKDADLFLEITGGLLTKATGQGEKEYQIFQPSEALSAGEILTLEEKFLAGEGQNITPARFAFGEISYEHVALQVRETLGKAAALLGVEGYARIDAFVRAWADGRVETIIIEINSLPGMTPATCIYHQAAIEGYTPFDFIDQIMAYGRARQSKLAAV
ncbi:MAG: D-alanine--D-alanine ligase [Saprospiraceae bacterium]